jgi:hypothetical protein
LTTPPRAPQAWGRSTKLQVAQRVLTDQQATPGAYARIHLHPKRFPAAYEVEWRDRVIHEGPDCVVVDKPPGVQVRCVFVHWRTVSIRFMRLLWNTHLSLNCLHSTNQQ